MDASTSLYLARERVHGVVKYFIRQSFRMGGGWRSRNVMDLGSDPTEFIVYPGGHNFFIGQAVEDRLRAQGVEYDIEAVEDIFWPFVRPEVKQAMEHFRRRSRTAASDLSYMDKQIIHTEVHPFDKRRYLFLKTGRLVFPDVDGQPAKYFRHLWHKSRDELEQFFIAQETILQAVEYKRYAYAAFNLQRYFPMLPAARTAPQHLDQKALDDHFLDDLCALNRDTFFWMGEPAEAFLHPHLRRMAVMFFDFSFGRQDMDKQGVRDALSRAAASGGDLPAEEDALLLFNLSLKDLLSLEWPELVRLYRSRALLLHPDHGGSHEQFVRLTQVFKVLVRRKKQI